MPFSRKPKCVRTVAVSLLVCMLMTGLHAFASAGEGTGALTDQQLLAMYPPGQVQAYREQFRAILSNMSTIAALTGAEKAQTDLASVQSKFLQIKDADIARWMAAGADLTPLQNAMQNALAVTISHPVRMNGIAAGPLYTTPGFPNATYGTACAGYSSDSDVVFAYTTALNAAKLVWFPLDRACNEVVVALGEGGNTSLLCIVPDETLQAAQFILDEYTVCDGDTSSGKIGGNYDRLAYINGQIDEDYHATINNDNANRDAIISNDNTNTANIIANDNTNTASIITNDNTNTANIIANDNANTATILAAIQALSGQQLQLAIENNLSKTNPVVGWFELPASAGGHLETAAQIVTDTINNLLISGQSVGSANYYLSLANSYYASGRYKVAYYYYALAYRTATSTWT